MRHVHGFFLEPEDSLDVVLIGASQLYTGYSAPLAWRDYGFTSYPLAVSNIPARLYGSLLTEAGTASTQLIAVAIDGFLNDENPESSRPTSASGFDNIPWSRNRIETIRTCVRILRSCRPSFYFNIAKYHANWYQVGNGCQQQRLRASWMRPAARSRRAAETVCKSPTAADEVDVPAADAQRGKRSICARSARRRRVLARMCSSAHAAPHADDRPKRVCRGGGRSRRLWL